MTVNIQHLWPTTIYTFKIEDGIDNEILYLEILEKEKKNQGFKFYPIQGGGWQSNKDLFDTDIVFSNLRKSLINNVNNILSNVYRDDAQIRLINSWANISRKGECTMPHIHEDSSWSSVYYVTPTKDATLYLKDPRTQEQMDSSHHFLKTPYSNIVRKRPFEAGEVILFPSWIEHGVGTGITESIRISIACNFLIQG